MKKVMSYSNLSKVAIIIIIACLLVAMFTGYQRMKFENNYKNVEISLDFNEMEKFSNATDGDLRFWLDKFNSLGASSVLIQEETINTLIKSGFDIKTFIVANLSDNLYWEKEFPSDLVSDINNNVLSKNDGIVQIGDEEIYNYIIEGLKLRYPDEFYNVYRDENMYYIVLSGITNDVYYCSTQNLYNVYGEVVSSIKRIADLRVFNIGIGYSKEKINLAKECNLDVILRPINYPRYTEKLVSAYETECKNYNIIPRVYIALGKEVLGYPNDTDGLETFLKDNNVKTVLVETGVQRENLNQEGLDDVVISTDYNTIRAFTMWDWIRLKYQVYGYEGAEEIENSLYRAITERNIRFIVFKPFFIGSNKYLTDVTEYERSFKSLSDRLEPHDMQYGLADGIGTFNIGDFRLGILCLGVAMASVYLFNSVFKLRNLFGKLLYLLALGGFFAPFVTRGLSEKLFSLFAAIAFSGLAIYYLMTMIKKVSCSKKELTISQTIIKSIIILIITCCISLMGAAFIVGILSDVKYMLELDIFRGVKVSQLLPFVIFLLILLIQFINENVKENSIKLIYQPISNILNKNIKVYYVLLAGILSFIGYIYIARTGHETTVEPSTLELIVRNFLENVLIARPRTKEFLIAFPAIFVAVFAANKKIPYITEAFMLVGVIASSSIINTFCHIRTPLYLSLDRTLISITFGIIIGSIAIIILNGIFKFIKNIQERLQ